MSNKHFFPDTAANTLVPRYLRALTRANRHLGLIESERVIYDTYHDPSTVSIISGGGSGHEPGWSGYVGSGALAAAACGDIFASPSTKQVLAAIQATPSDQGHILMITNYTGDKLHFGLAAERARASGLCKNIAMIFLTDDVAIGRSKCGAVGRRGLAGHVIPMKMTGAAAARGMSFEQCARIGAAVNQQVVSIGSALDHCHVPGRRHNESLPSDVVVVGAGIHNEPGAQRLSPFPPVNDLISHCLDLLCSPDDQERHFVNFEQDDETVLLVNNIGGLSNLELGALSDEVLTQLETTWYISPARVLVGTFETSLNAPGFSISLCNVTAASKEAGISSEELLDLLDEKTAAVSWPNQTPKASKPTTQLHGNLSPVSVESGYATDEGSSSLRVDPKQLESAIRRGCEATISAEPKLTEWDTVLGDGDCGEAVKGVSEAVIRILNEGGASSGSIVDFLNHITVAVDDMGGTLGAILGILLSALTTALNTSPTYQSDKPVSATLSSALEQAVISLKTYTGAREGDRTVMDVLLPFAADFARTQDFFHAVEVARSKAQGTSQLKARFGRATYVAEAEGQDLPDPGAWALYEWLNGASTAIQGFSS